MIKSIITTPNATTHNAMLFLSIFIQYKKTAYYLNFPLFNFIICLHFPPKHINTFIFSFLSKEAIMRNMRNSIEHPAHLPATAKLLRFTIIMLALSITALSVLALEKPAIQDAAFQDTALENTALQNQALQDIKNSFGPLQPLADVLRPLFLRLSVIVGGIFGLYVFLIAIRVYYERKKIRILRDIRYDFDQLNIQKGIPASRHATGGIHRLLIDKFFPFHAKKHYQVLAGNNWTGKSRKGKSGKKQ